jgi:hypothetical protein
MKGGKLFGIILVSNEYCYIFAGKMRPIVLINSRNTDKYYVLDIGIGIKTGRCALACD